MRTPLMTNNVGMIDEDGDIVVNMDKLEKEANEVIFAFILCASEITTIQKVRLV